METTSVTYAADCFMLASVSFSALCVHLFLQHVGTAAAAAAAASGLTPHTALAHDACVLAGITRACGPVIWLNSIVALTLSDASTAAAAAVGLMPHTALAPTHVCSLASHVCVAPQFGSTQSWPLPMPELSPQTTQQEGWEAAAAAVGSSSAVTGCSSCSTAYGKQVVMRG